MAVIISVFNRKEKTLQCLKTLFSFLPDANVFLVDDNSIDGTADAVSRTFDRVEVIKGTGDLYWNRGMHLAWSIAAKKDHDFYLWLNDDVVLFKNFIEELLYCSKSKNNEAIIVGHIQDMHGVNIIYGGTNEKGQLWPVNGKLNRVSNMNGNVVLVPKFVFEKVGNLDPRFQHDFGDVDYGYRAMKLGIGVYTTRFAVGIGENHLICRVRIENATVFERFRRLYSPLGSNPFIQFYFQKKHRGFLWAIIYFVFLHFLNILPDTLNKKVFGNRYV